MGSLLGMTTSILATPPISEKRQILQKASYYAQSVACMTTFEEGQTFLKDVYLLDSDYSGNQEYGTYYVVFWSGDYGCNGGSGTYNSYFTSFHRASSLQDFTVDEGNLFEELITSRFIERVSLNNKVFTIDTLEYGPNDTNSTPSEKYRYRIKYNNHQWTLLGKVFLGKHNYNSF